MSRRGGQEDRLNSLESAYRVALFDALADTARGSSLLFEDNDEVLSRQLAARLLPPRRAELYDLAEVIDEVRSRLGFDAFELHRRFLAVSGDHGANAPGEAKRAAAFLQDLRNEEALK